ncbi:MAG: SPOR domain-containing protein [Rikenellaceae bacterium]
MFFAFESVVAQQIQPRIVGLEIDSNYMRLLSEDNALTIQEDSIGVIVEALREQFRANPDTETDSRKEIIMLENNLFDIRARKAVVVDSLNFIEQSWILNNMGNVEYAQKEQPKEVGSSSDVDFIFKSDNVKSNLSSVDYKNLVRAEELEPEVKSYREAYMRNYDTMLSLKSSYDMLPSQDEALQVQQRFDSLKMVNIRVLEQLSDAWGYIYDNKSFAYSILMELHGFSDVLQQETELMREAQAEISSLQQQGGNEELLRYVVQKNSLLPFEILVAEKLGLNRAADSLNRVKREYIEHDRVVCPEIAIEERLFIDYEPIEFVSQTPYNSNNPIPETVIYEKGTIYRIIVGSFSTKPSNSTFRNTIPVSYRKNEEGRYSYYIGGYATVEEAEEARESLKKHGFRVPEVVMWYDGRERNITKNPLTITTTYRIEIENQSTLPEGAVEQVREIAPNGAISKVGNDKFVITHLDSQSQVDSLVNLLQQLDPFMRPRVEKLESTIDF